MSERRGGLRFRVLRLTLLVMLLNGVYLGHLRQHRFRFIVVHHSAGRVGDYRSIRQFHTTNRDWTDAAYHLILSNGSTSVPEGHLEATGRYRTLSFSPATRSGRHNVHGLHICVVGDYDTEVPSELVRGSLANALGRLREKFHIPTSNILLHRDCSTSRCPGKNLTRDGILEWISEERGDLPEGIRAQHEHVLSEAGPCGPCMDLFAGRIVVYNLLLLSLLAASLLTRRFLRRRRAVSHGPLPSEARGRRSP